MLPGLVILGIEGLQRQAYPDNEDWFFDVQTVDQLMDFLLQMVEAGEEIE